MKRFRTKCASTQSISDISILPFVIQSDKRLPEIRPGSNRKYGISEVYSREKLRGVAGSRGRGFDPRGPSNTQGPKITEK